MNATWDSLVRDYVEDHPNSLVAELVRDIGVAATACLLNRHPGHLYLPSHRRMKRYYCAAIAAEYLKGLRGRQRLWMADRLKASLGLKSREQVYALARRVKR
jgi:hypothetical protein